MSGCSRKAGTEEWTGGPIASAYRDHAAVLYRYAVMVTCNVALAEDAIQQVFVKLLARDPLPWREGAGFAYLRRAVRNECYRLLQCRHLNDVGMEDLPILVPIDAELVNQEERKQLEQMLRKLPPDQREVIHMKVYEQLTFQQIAEQLGESIHTISGRYRYGLDKLRRWMTPASETLS